MPSDVPSAAPQPRKAWRHFAVPAVLALVGYITLYSVDAHLRVRRGPWEVTFFADTDGTPAVRVDQPGLGISRVTVRFAGEQLPEIPPPGLPATVRFAEPAASVPFGKTAFDDLMYLPGTVVLHCFGHEVQMLPRTLYLDRQAHGWSNSAVHTLPTNTKPSRLTPPPRTSRLGRSRGDADGAGATPPPR